jgi:hypothetical protein
VFDQDKAQHVEHVHANLNRCQEKGIFLNCENSTTVNHKLTSLALHNGHSVREEIANAITNIQHQAVILTFAFYGPAVPPHYLHYGHS